MSITVTTYTNLNAAYDYFNKELFDGKLPECLITLAYHRGAYGYFRGHAFAKRDSKSGIVTKEGRQRDEIALNPFTFNGRTDREILSTLVHEMCHLWRDHFGSQPVPKTHHDKVWAAKMDEVGLTPTSTGQPGGKRTGRRVTHMIVEKGPYDKAWAKCGIKLNWNGLMSERDKKPRKRTKYCCPKCGANAYGKADLVLLCGDHKTPVRMEEE